MPCVITRMSSFSGAYLHGPSRAITQSQRVLQTSSEHAILLGPSRAIKQGQRVLQTSSEHAILLELAQPHKANVLQTSSEHEIPLGPSRSITQGQRVLQTSSEHAIPLANVLQTSSEHAIPLPMCCRRAVSTQYLLRPTHAGHHPKRWAMPKCCRRVVSRSAAALASLLRHALFWPTRGSAALSDCIGLPLAAHTRLANVDSAMPWCQQRFVAKPIGPELAKAGHF
jgi:hypothetical protein